MSHHQGKIPREDGGEVSTETEHVPRASASQAHPHWRTKRPGGIADTGAIRQHGDSRGKSWERTQTDVTRCQRSDGCNDRSQEASNGVSRLAQTVWKSNVGTIGLRAIFPRC
jgi:hypothetical protein